MKNQEQGIKGAAPTQDRPKQQRSFRRGRVRVCLTKDPETPCMVYLWVRKGWGNGFNVETATFHCAVDTGEVMGYDLTESECKWLESLNQVCTEWFDQHRGV